MGVLVFANHMRRVNLAHGVQRDDHILAEWQWLQQIEPVVQTHTRRFGAVVCGAFVVPNSVAGEVLGSNSFDINSIASIGKTVGAAAAVGLVNLIVITVMGAICAILYNAAAKITGGLSVGFTNQQ